MPFGAARTNKTTTVTTKGIQNGWSKLPKVGKYLELSALAVTYVEFLKGSVRDLTEKSGLKSNPSKPSKAMLLPSFCPSSDSNGLRLLRITQDKLRLQTRKISALQLLIGCIQEEWTWGTSASEMTCCYISSLAVSPKSEKISFLYIKRDIYSLGNQNQLSFS